METIRLAVTAVYKKQHWTVLGLPCFEKHCVALLFEVGPAIAFRERGHLYVNRLMFFQRIEHKPPVKPAD